MRLAHISDTHFGAEEAGLCAALRDDLLRQAPDLVVLTGDITQRARQAQFRAARAFLDSLAPLPVLALPGNHDLPLFDLVTRFSEPYRYYRRYLCHDLAPTWQNDRVAVVGVNSTRMWRHKHGVLPPPLVQAVAEQLAALPQALKIVALHHPLAIIEPSDRRNLARGAEAALAAWSAAGADLFLGGHIHLPYCVLVGNNTLPARPAIVLQAGTAVSWRRRAGLANSYNLVQLTTEGGRRMDIERRDYDARSGAFALKTTRRASGAAGRWRLLPDALP
jgi:3',5'-cyclic AMP phosphodiesterase CpdA